MPRAQQPAKPAKIGHIANAAVTKPARNSKAASGRAIAKKRTEGDSKKENDERREAELKREDSVDVVTLDDVMEEEADQADDEDSYFEKVPQSWHGNNGISREYLTYWRSTQRGRSALKKKIEEKPYEYIVQRKLRRYKHKHIQPRSKEGYAPFDDHISEIDTDDERRDDRCFMLVEDHKIANKSSNGSRDPIFGGSEAKFERWGHY